MKNVVIFGMLGYGKIARYLLKTNEYNMIAFLDSKIHNVDKSYLNQYYDIPIISHEDLLSTDFDYIILSAPNHFVAMKESLLALNIPEEKILYLDFNNNIFYDDLRIAQLKLCLEKIKFQNIEGDMAEVGVFKGDFSYHLNYYFPNKKLFLFDTFEGFPETDLQNENNILEVSFSNTSEEYVLNRMHNKNNCQICKGYFPKSIPSNISQKFSFVSLDTDLYNPIYEGLNYFYPRLVKGGYIFVHDYGVCYWTGVKKAVDQFCKENDISFIPVIDKYSSIIITK